MRKLGGRSTVFAVAVIAVMSGGTSANAQLAGVIAADTADENKDDNDERSPTKSQRTSSPNALFFAGLDLWRGGNYEHGGLYWAPDGIDRDGFTLKLLLSNGVYHYTSGALGGQRIDGRQLGAQILPGWRFTRDAVEVKVFAGVEWLRNVLIPDDTAAGLRGQRIALRMTTEVWYAPDPPWMIAGHVSIATIGTRHDARVAAGWRFFDLFYAGPELAEFSAFNYRQYRAGLHVTSLRTGAWEWSGALGYARDSDRISGGYARLGLLTRR